MKIPILIVFLAAIANFLLAQQTVFLEAGEFGRGILKSRSGQCYAIGPAHVVENAIGKIEIVGKDYVVSKGEVIKLYYTNDLGLIRITSGEEQYCTSWEVKPDFGLMLSLISEAYLELPTSTGSRDLIPVNIREYNDGTITIKLKSDNEFIQKGMSGSSLFSNYEGEKVYLGMLMEVEDNLGYVLQADNMDRVLFDFFNVQFGNEPNRIESNDPSVNLIQERNRIQKDIDFLENHFKEIMTNNSAYLTVKYNGFSSAALEEYRSHPNGLGNTEQQKRNYRIKSKELVELLIDSKKTIKDNPDSWDQEAIPKISMIILKLVEIKDTLN